MEALAELPASNQLAGSSTATLKGKQRKCGTVVEWGGWILLRLLGLCAERQGSRRRGITSSE